MKDYPEDYRLENALNAVNEWLGGNMKLTVVKKFTKDVQVVAREAEENPVAKGAARAIGGTTTINTITSSLGLAFYGSAAIVY